MKEDKGVMSNKTRWIKLESRVMENRRNLIKGMKKDRIIWCKIMKMKGK